MGYRCVIAPSFGDIFFNNCFQTGMLPIVLPAATVVELATEAAAGREFTVDLTQQIITAPSGRQVPFRVDGAKRRALLEGLEEIQMTLTLADEIAGFQDSDRRRRPWIYRF
jgi:3-isopropylmalate/(R)-2-methylmalate dehydratase small subunit